jgi:hypothetical protein
VHEQRITNGGGKILLLNKLANQTASGFVDYLGIAAQLFTVANIDG